MGEARELGEVRGERISKGRMRLEERAKDWR